MRQCQWLFVQLVFCWFFSSFFFKLKINIISKCEQTAAIINWAIYVCRLCGFCTKFIIILYFFLFHLQSFLPCKSIEWFLLRTNKSTFAILWSFKLMQCVWNVDKKNKASESLFFPYLFDCMHAYITISCCLFYCMAFFSLIIAFHNNLPLVLFANINSHF